MKISKDPRETAIHEGGPYAVNFNNWVIAKDNIKIPNSDVLSADDGGGYTGAEGVVLKFVRKDGDIVIDANGEPVTTEVRGSVTIYGQQTTCEGCDSIVQQDRVNQPWWYL